MLYNNQLVRVDIFSQIFGFYPADVIINSSNTDNCKLEYFISLMVNSMIALGSIMDCARKRMSWKCARDSQAQAPLIVFVSSKPNL